MSVEADDDGLIFREGVLKKIEDLKKIANPKTRIWVDGGINKSNLERVVKAGADIKIKCKNCGREIMMDRLEFHKKLKKVIENGKEN